MLTMISELDAWGAAISWTAALKCSPCAIPLTYPNPNPIYGGALSEREQGAKMESGPGEMR